MIYVFYVLTFLLFAMLGAFFGSAFVIVRVWHLQNENERLMRTVTMEQKRRESLETLLVWNTVRRNFKREVASLSKRGWQ